ncbi:nucleoside triphosphate pyrophosphohydrolase [Bacillus massilinigeriensis]|uniref:nucleoside triphosphate pyrophosphohydrolase n=1 Tax=Bacillus mediterraneensis TaxID=1805474 RepID=UPI0008F8AF44|nr:nucleoside triphosphate pyrophosphohydrolase [Bacillus mediterraneensis]
MEKIKYNKLVRDGIPDLLKEQGKSFSTGVLNDKEYSIKLQEALVEEMECFVESRHDKLAGDIADLLEIIYAIAEQRGITEPEIEFTRQMKKKQLGGYGKKLIIEPAGG